MSTNEQIEWDIDVSILTNRFIMGELLKVLGIAAGITAATVLLISLPAILGGEFVSNSSNASGMKYTLMLVGILFTLTALFIFAYYGNRYMLSYILDSKSARTISRTEQQNKNSKWNFLLVIIGLLARNPTATGTGFLAESRQNQDMKWKNVRKVTFYPHDNTITLSGGYGEKSILFCKKENYGTVSELVRSKCTSHCKVKEK